MQTCYVYLALQYDFLADKTLTKKTLYQRYRSRYSEDTSRMYANIDMKIKTGETANRGQRAYQLRKDEGLDIYESVKFMGTKSDRLFVESYVRSCIENRYSNFNIMHVGNDHFVCLNSNVIRTIQREFYTYVDEALEALTILKERRKHSV